jgi:hypothetical protein
MEVTVNKQQFRKLATVGAAAALSLQLLAGVASAAVPTATSGGQSWNFSGDGRAGFEATYSYGDSSTLSRLYLEADITNGASARLESVTKNGNAVSGCSVQSSPLAIKCLFRTVRNTDEFVVQFSVVPADNTADVTAEPLWSTTGYVTGGNNSHGDAWDEAGILVSHAGSDANVAEGFGNTSLHTGLTNLGGNGQAASLELPLGLAYKYAKVNDNAGDGGDFPLIEIQVNNGNAATFIVVIVYPKGTNAPSSYIHSTNPTPYTACQKGKPKVDCFDWSNKTNTVTLYLSHNGTLRRSG